MRIRQIELVGFKSFRDPTRLVLAPGINAVVGPNGCGKSNIADALRWVLGEQSVKHLRARDMEDVIFGGNAKSAALGLAEVSVTFEQPDGEGLDLDGEVEGLAAHVARQHEFTITRRIFRSGESQYLINQAPARLRDITELFLGSGVGPKAYAMIEQGRVGQIVNAKPEELRLFIEEAAGTTRFRSRKLAAERKLDRTNDNLVRVQDVMREIERQLGTLRRQAKRAEEFKQLEAELTRTEVALSGARWRSLSGERETALADLGAVRLEQEEITGRIDGAEAAKLEAMELERSATQQIEAAYATVSDLSSVVVRMSERQSAVRDACTERQARVEKLGQENAELETAVRRVEETVARARAEQGAHAERERAESATLESASTSVEAMAPLFDAAQTEYGSASGALAETRRQVSRQAAEIAKNSERLSGLREERGRIEARLRDRHDAHGRAQGDLEAAGTTRAAAHAAVERLEGDRRQATQEFRTREEELRRLEESLAAMREVLLHRRGRLDGLREREAALDGYAEGLDAAMAFAPRPSGLVLDGLVIPPDLEPAVAAVLGESMRGAVVASTRDAIQIAAHLRETGAGRVTFVPASGPAGSTPALPEGVSSLASLVDAMPGAERVRDSLLAGVAVVDDLAQAQARQGDAAADVTWVTRTGDVLDRRGIVTGGRAPESADLLLRRREASELAAQIAEDEIRQAALERRLTEARAECHDLGAELERLDAEAHRCTLGLVAADHAVETARRDVTTSERLLAEARSELEACDGSHGLAEEARVVLEEAGRELAELERRANERVGAAEAALLARRSEIEGARSQRDACRQALADAREALARAEGELARLEHERAMSELRREGLAAELAHVEREQAEAHASLDGLEAELAVRRAELRAGEEAVEAARDAARRWQNDLRECEARLSEIRRELEAARERGQAAELRSAELAAQIDALVTYSLERHEVDPAEAEVPEDFDAAAASTTVQGIKDRIAKLGDVNVAAIADARELEERYAFLEGQRADLESSIENLRQTIGELSRATRSRFRDTFELANAKFETYFRELFRGGNAALKLTAPHNLLETGVEMEVQPPGKSLRTLESLSGGEKAMTAISLLMALFSLRATPFCVLDEVDAPLDEANLGRFNAMIQRMSARTQFVVITHHQQTMESAHVLYGVTMAEPGVSQLVSVELPADEGARNDLEGSEGLAMAASA